MCKNYVTLKSWPGLALTLLLLAGLVLMSAPAVMAQSLALPEEVQARLSSGARIRVIVEFDAPQIDYSGDSGERIRSQSEYFNTVRDGVIARALGQPATAMRAEPSGSPDARIIRTFDYSPGAAMYLSQDEIVALTTDPGVVRIVNDDLSRPMLDGSIPLIGAAALHANGLKGLNRSVAILDTGVDHQHPMFSGRFAGSACFSSTVAGQSESFCPGGVSTDTLSAEAGDNCLMESDTGSLQSNDCFHGTHVAGIATGALQNVPGGPAISGVAPAAGIVAVQVFSYFNDDSFCGTGRSPCALSYSSDQIAALEWLNTNRAAFDLAAINMSLGSGRFFTACNSDSRTPIISTLRANGVATVISSGNNGYTDSVAAPGCVEAAITAGSTTMNDALSGFSNSAAMVDVLAPGSAILSARPTANGDGGAAFTSASGTSMAAPHVAGAFAVLMAANPGASVSDIETALEMTGLAITNSAASPAKPGFTKPRIQIDQAHSLLQGNPYLSVTPASSWLVTMAAGGVISQSRIYTLTNHGRSPLEWSVSDDQSWLTRLSAESGTLAAGASTSAVLVIPSWVFPTGHPDLSQTAHVTFTQNGGGANISRIVSLTVGNPPGNDDFSDAVTLTGLAASASGSTIGATTESGEPSIGTGAVNTAWWSWTPSVNGEVEIHTDGSSFDTVLGVFTGNTVNTLVPAGTNDDSVYGLQSQLIFTAVAGQTYSIAVAGYNGASGEVSLTINQSADNSLLVVTRTGTGSGTVNSVNDTSIRCGADCQEELPQGSEIELMAIASPGSVFDGWAGEGANTCAGTHATSCVLTLPAQDISNVFAAFSLLETVTVTLRTEGLGQGHIEDNGVPVCPEGTCLKSLSPGDSVSLTAIAAGGSSFAGWTSGGCADPVSTHCVLSPAGDTVITARFTDDTVGPAAAWSAVLPGARSGQAGGDVITALMSVVTGDGAAQSCRVDAGGSDVATLAYDLLDDSGQSRGLNEPVFDIVADGRVDLLLAVTPLRETPPEGAVFFPRLTCSNASAAAIEGVNSLRLSITDAPGPDILSIGVTPSGDGVVRLPTADGTGFMAVAAMNIGLLEDTPIRVVADTGAVQLPVQLSVCETDAAGHCLSSRAAFADTVFSGREAHFFSVFVTAIPGPGVPFDPANARVFLRFISPDGIIRSVTSAALTSPATMNAQDTSQLAGIWSVLVRQDENTWPDLERGYLVIAPDGRALFDDGQSVSRIHVDAGDLSDGSAVISVNAMTGRWFGDGRIRAGRPMSGLSGFQGLRSIPDDAASNAGLSTNLENRLRVELMARRSFPECGVSWHHVFNPSQIFELALTGCENAGTYLSAWVPADSGRDFHLIMADRNSGWRLTK